MLYDLMVRVIRDMYYHSERLRVIWFIYIRVTWVMRDNGYKS
jgi:hypothetical protein